MNGDTKTLLEFLKLVGKVDYVESHSDEIESFYSIKLEPDYSEINLNMLNRLQSVVFPNKIKIWFYHDIDTEQNECKIEIQILRSKK